MYPEIVSEKAFMPRRSSRNVGKLRNCEPRRFVSNFYDVKLLQSLNKVFVYEAKFPSLPDDSSQIMARALWNVMGELRTSIGFLCFSGKLIYGLIQNKQALSYQAKVYEEFIEVHFKLIKQLQVIELIKDPKTRPSIFHFLNSKLKSCMRNANLCELGKGGQYFLKDQLTKDHKNEMKEEYYNLERAGMNVLRGYKFTLAMINGALKLQLDVCSRVLQKTNLLQEFMNFVGSNQELKAFYEGSTIITRYGNYRTYKIEQIDFTIGPTCTFDFKGQQISYLQYFKKAYNADIENHKQPMLKVVALVKKQINKKQLTINNEPKYIFLVPELVSLTGMKDQQRANFESMKALAPFTKLDPNDRFVESYKILGTLNQAKDILQIGNEVQMNGFFLHPPEIIFHEPASIRSGTITNRGQLYQPHIFHTWMFVYSIYNSQDFNEAVAAENYLREASKVYGIQYKEPTYIEIQGAQKQVTPYDFCDFIKKAVQTKKEKYELILILLKTKESKFYGIIKDALTNDLGIPCQVIQSKTISRGKSILSIAGKVAIQMSCKAGDAPWVIENRVPYFQNRNFAYAAISTSKGKGGFTISFVGTTNNLCSEMYSGYIVKMPRKEKIQGIILKKWFVNWIKSYFMANKKLPDTLLFYRESMGQSLMKAVLEHEIFFLKESLEDVRKKTKKPGYEPEIVYIFVNKRVNSRFFQADRKQVYNPEPGSIIVEEMSVDDRFDFHLVAQKVNQGTATPTHYMVAYDNSKIPQEDLIKFTYEQCYNYYNWQGSVKIPACLQNANKLSKLAGESIQKPLNQSKVNETFYFL